MVLTKTVFSLDAFDDVQVGLDWNPPAEPATMAEALAYFGNDEDTVKKALYKAIFEVEKEKALDTPLEQWHSFAESDDEEAEPVLNGPADIKPIHMETVKKLELNLAKQQFGFARGRGSENNQAARKSAREFIKKNPALKQALVAESAAKLAMEAALRDATAPPTAPTA